MLFSLTEPGAVQKALAQWFYFTSNADAAGALQKGAYQNGSGHALSLPQSLLAICSSNLWQQSCSPSTAQTVPCKSRRRRSRQKSHRDLPFWLETGRQRAAHALQQCLHHVLRRGSPAPFAALNLGFSRKEDPSAPARHQADLRELFDRIDVDGNGQLDRSELQVCALAGVHSGHQFSQIHQLLSRPLKHCLAHKQ